MLVSHDCQPRYICSPFRAPNRKIYNEKIPKVFPTSYLAGPHHWNISGTIERLAKWYFSSMWVIYIGRASSMCKGFWKKDRWHAISFVRFNEAFPKSALVLLSEDAQTCFLLCFYIVIFCFEDAPLFPYLSCLFLSFCLKRWGGIISCCFCFFVVLGYSSFLSLFCSCLFWGVLRMHHLVLLTFPASACFRPQEKKDNSPTNPGAEKIWMKPGCHQRF